MYESKKSERQRKYLAEALILSEIFSLIQSSLNIFNYEISYISSILFLSASAIIMVTGTVHAKILYAGIILAIIVIIKISIQGVDQHYVKALLLIALIPYYALVAKKTDFQSIEEAAKKYKYMLIIIGCTYLWLWFLYGGYRNASTIFLALILFIISGEKKRNAIMWLAAAVMKTQYIIWVAITYIIVKFPFSKFSSLALLVLGISTAVGPLYIDSALVQALGFNASQVSSMDERLNEIRVFSYIMTSDIYNVIFGWVPGYSLELSDTSERGYMHNAPLWITGSLGLPLSVLLYVYIATRNIKTMRFFAIKSFGILANTFTFLLLTNPLITILLFTNEKK